MQTNLDERIAFVPRKMLPNIKQVTAEAPCFSCGKNLEPKCDVCSCEKITAWLMEDEN